VSVPSSSEATKSLPDTSDTERLTGSAAVVTPARVTVKRAAAPSVTGDASRAMVTTGRSSSLTVTVAEAGAPTL